MEINIAKAYKRELQKNIAELLKEYEKTTGLDVNDIKIVRQSTSDQLGNETDFSYAVEVISNL